TIYYAGVAEGNGEFGVWSATQTPGTGLPGRFGVDYAFISEAAVDVHVDQNHLNLFRVAFLLERMCPPATGLGAAFNETHFDYFKEAVDYITVTKGAYAILDPHNYMRYNVLATSLSREVSLATPQTPQPQPRSSLASFGVSWHLASMTMSAHFWAHERATRHGDLVVLANNQAAIDAIRAANASNLIIMPGNSWTGGHSWTEGSDPSSALLNQFKDPLNNTAIDIHEYLDYDFSGGHLECVSDPETNLAALTAWLKENNLKAFITEFGGSNSTSCQEMLPDLINYMADNAEYIGWTAWAAGPSGVRTVRAAPIQPSWVAWNLGAQLLTKPWVVRSVWLPVIQPLVPTELQWSGPASISGGELTSEHKDLCCCHPV
nr:cellulase (EC 3.2.1.4) - fungus (Pestalotiopsis sp.) [Pestalotiopsis sp.]